jgi:signal transduction histidine kinase
MRRYDGAYRWVFSSGGPIVSQSGELLGYIGTGVDIHDFKEAQQELVRYSHKLERSNKDLEHFATIASHDLQEPLRKVILFSDHLRKVGQNSLDAEALDDIERIQRATGTMQRLINDLLDLSRVTRRGKPFQKVSLYQLVESAVADLAFTFQNIHGRVSLEGEAVISADGDQIYQMMLQLLDNALKFHKPEAPSRVDVKLGLLDGNRCQIRIEDNGIGIRAGHLNQIFDTFTRLHHGKEYPGTGIGLALVQKIVERHEGNIRVESIPGEGSVFTVTLPLFRETPENQKS